MTIDDMNVLEQRTDDASITSDTSNFMTNVQK